MTLQCPSRVSFLVIKSNFWVGGILAKSLQTITHLKLFTLGAMH